MKILLISDTHGELRWINLRVRETGADAVIHAGDFGFYDEESPERLSDRELALRIVHSSLPEEQRKKAFDMSREARIALIRERLPLSDLPAYLRGEKMFSVPVYAVWGNHEDVEVLRALREGRARARNLTLLDETAVHHLGALRLFGIGGNFLKDTRLFDPPLAGSGGKVWATLSQFARLAKKVKEDKPAKANIFVSHVSPGKEPLLRHLAAHLEAEFLVSGHMGTPYPCVWSELAIRELPEAEAVYQKALARVEEAWEQAREWIHDEEERHFIEEGLRLLSSAPQKQYIGKRGQREPAWYRGAFAINLPDARDGYALLIEEKGVISLETRARGRLFG